MKTDRQIIEKLEELIELFESLDLALTHKDWTKRKDIYNEIASLKAEQSQEVQEQPEKTAEEILFFEVSETYLDEVGIKDNIFRAMEEYAQQKKQ
jgi:hypothetical protein